MLHLALQDRRVLALTSASLLCVYLLTMAGRLTSGDGETVYQTTRALVTRGQLGVPQRPETAPGRNGTHYGKYGLGQSIVQAPFFVVGHVVGRVLDVSDDRPARFTVAMTNSFVTAALAAVFWITARTLGAGSRAATGATLTLGIATPLWPYARSDFSEPLQTLCLLVVFLCTLWWWRRPTTWLAIAVGGAAAAAFLTKAASTVVLVPLGAFYLYCVWLRLRKAPRRGVGALLSAALPVAIAGLLQGALNLYRFGSPSEFGYGTEPALGFTTPLLTGAGYLLFSSGKGLLWFAPPALLGAFLLVPLARRRPVEALAILAVSLFELAYFARWWAWHGDWSWGPRYLYLTLPFLLLPIALLLDRILVRVATAPVAIAGLVVAVLGVVVDYGGYYSVVSSQIGRGVDVTEARLVPPFSPILGHAWLARASAHQLFSAWRDKDHDARANPAWGQHPWAASHPGLAPEAPERAVGFDLWFLALPNRTRFAEFWSWLVAAWLAACACRLALALWRELRAAPSLQAPGPAVVRRDTPEPMELAWQRG